MAFISESAIEYKLRFMQQRMGDNFSATKENSFAF